jgi:hypothetical protein
MAQEPMWRSLLARHAPLDGISSVWRDDDEAAEAGMSGGAPGVAATSGG